MWVPRNVRAEIAGVPYETIPALKGVLHMDKADNTQAVLLTDSAEEDKVIFAAGVAGIYTPDTQGIGGSEDHCASLRTILSHQRR